MDSFRHVHFDAPFRFRTFQTRSRMNCSERFSVCKSFTYLPGPATRTLREWRNLLRSTSTKREGEILRFSCWAMADRKRSEVWLSFTRKDSDTAKCNTCSREISCKGGSTSNMMKHLLQHGVNVKECTVFDVLRSPSPSNNRAPDTANDAITANSSNVSPSGTKHRWVDIRFSYLRKTNVYNTL